jgi:UDP-N-acetylmuramyl pentapeptide phosphotransferase/UDP-N-acetylglucosamine-1-phosphate transferase
MNHLLQIDLYFHQYKPGLFSLISAFVITLICIPPIIFFVKKFNLYDIPDQRKEHHAPIPTMGGIAIWLGMMVSLLLWFPFADNSLIVVFIFSLFALFIVGIMDDLHNLSARYKFIIQIALAAMIAVAGLRITSFNGLFGIETLPLPAQFTLTILAIVGITNAFNLIDGIDGLAGGLGFMSLITLGLFLTICGDTMMAIVAFSLAGGLLAFLYFNFNPARIFMGDTGSLVLGFVISIMCLRLIQVNTFATNPLIHHVPVFTLGIVLIPVFDTLRVFGTRIWKGKSPFSPDRTHIHHLLTNSGFSHSFTSGFICSLNGLILLETFWLKNIRPEFLLAILTITMLVIISVLKQLPTFLKRHTSSSTHKDYELS